MTGHTTSPALGLWQIFTADPNNVLLERNVFLA
jgi:hypothetical protein